MSSRKYQILSLWFSTWTWGLVWDRAVPWWTMAKKGRTDKYKSQLWWGMDDEETDVWSEERALRVQRQKMRRKKRENFTRRRCWWSKRKNEKGVRDSETRRERERDGHREKRDFQGETSIWETEREKERTQGLPFIRSSLPPIDYQIYHTHAHKRTKKHSLNTAPNYCLHLTFH